jgi:PAS domain S-box-containing protein
MSNTQILVVEDEAIVAKNIGMELKSMGYSVCGVASCGEDAVKMATDIQPDLVLMDIVLKGELDGVETTQKIREHLDVPVVYLTAYADDQMLERAKRTGPHGYLLKPYEERELHTTIQIALHKYQLERALREMQQWLSSTLRWMADGVILTDARGDINLINPVAQQLTGWSQDSAVGKSWNEVFRIVDEKSGDAWEGLAARGLKAGAATGLGDLALLVNRDGSQRPVEGTFSAVYDPAGNFGGWVVLFRDVTEHRRAEEAIRHCQQQLRRWEKVESIGRVTGGLAHDINHLLTAVIGNISLVLEDLPSGDSNRVYLERAQKIALRAGETVKQLVGFARRKKRQWTAVDFNGAVWEIAELLCCLLDPKISLEVNADEDLWPVLGDAGQLKEVVFNLCLNARDAMPGGGQMLLQTENIVLDEETSDVAGSWRRGEYVCLRVSDTGEGIPAEIRARVLEPFFTTKTPDEGGGLGLALVTAIIEQHGGWIDISSEVGQGTRVEIYLPRYETEEPDARE